MDIEELTKLARKRRSTRRFKHDPIPDGYIQKILEVSRWAMSGANGQPWEYIVIKDRAIIDGICEIYSRYHKTLHELEKTRMPEYRHLGVDREITGTPGFKDAPVIIVVMGDQRTVQASCLGANLLGESKVLHENLANATQLIHLAACALGLASEWVSIGHTMEGELKALLGIPGIYRVETIVPLGYPAYELKGGYRRPLRELIHVNKYDPSKYRTDEKLIGWLASLRKRSRKGYLV